MQCPSCQSDNVQRLKLIYESGTHNIQTTSRTGITGYSFRGGLGFGAATTQTSGTQQNIAARNAAPPAKKSYKTILIMALIAFFMLYYASTQYHAPGWNVLGILLLGVAGWMGYRAYSYNSRIWPEEHRVWSISWQCHKCGDVYVH